MARILTRDTDGAVIAGVAAGFARYFDVDPVVARIAFIVLAFLHGLGVILYAVCWVIVPKRSDAPSPADGSPGSAAGPAPPAATGAAGAPGETPADRLAEQVKHAGERVVENLKSAERDPARGQMIAGIILLGLGLLFLAPRLGLWFWPRWLSLWDLWPVILIVIGASMLLGPWRNRS
jgi:phage shock protein PspC (stress-responsive transcriptional regulator)